MLDEADLGAGTRETGSATSARVTVASETRGSRTLTPPRQSGMIIVTDKLARRCWKHPGPRRHLMGQVMRSNCTTRRPAPDRRRVSFISEK